jgi:hypothetical protein
LFLLFPGFFWWVSGFEFQPYVLSVSLEVLSIAFTLKAVGPAAFSRRVGWIAGAIVLGWIYLALVEYAIGMELFRFLCVYLALKRQKRNISFIKIVQKTIRSAGVFLVIPLGFVIWYQFLFDNWRKAQDAARQLSQLLDSPANLFLSVLRLVESTFNVSLLAWTVPFSNHYFAGRISQILIGLIFTVLAILMVILAHSFLAQPTENGQETVVHEWGKWQADAIVFGLIGTIGGVLPVVMANRLATFDRYSHYMLPASLAGALFIGGWLFFIYPKTLRLITLSMVIGFASLTHHALAVEAINEQKSIREFWWQVVWRAPLISDDSLLVVVYPGVYYGDGDEVAWGPANFIYYPQPQQKIPVRVTLAAIRMESESMRKVVLGSGVDSATDRVIKWNSIAYNYENVLVLTQPSSVSCMHALDNKWPGISIYDDYFILAASKNSKIENIMTSGVAPAPPPYVFGEEPEHDWCFYFQQADLARQNGNWEEVIRIDKKINKLGISPGDPIEWTPFLQAYAVLGDAEGIRQIAKLVKKEEFYKEQSCQNLRALGQHGFSLQPEMENLIEVLFCS